MRPDRGLLLGGAPLLDSGRGAPLFIDCSARNATHAGDTTMLIEHCHENKVTFRQRMRRGGWLNCLFDGEASDSRGRPIRIQFRRPNNAKRRTLRTKRQPWACR